MKVVEHFVSINGEGRRAGQLALFIRFAGCNLNCRYCDTAWANAFDVEYEEYSVEELVKLIETTGVWNVTLTGGEPLLQPRMKELLGELRKNPHYHIEIETNGSIDICDFYDETEVEDSVSFTLDYKTGASGQESKMCLKNYEQIRPCDTVKFVVGSEKDLIRAREVIETYSLIEKGCGIYISPCFGMITPVELVDFLVHEKLNGVNVQLQLHKYIWDPEQRGV